jgi:hypothetical protein
MSTLVPCAGHFPFKAGSASVRPNGTIVAIAGNGATAESHAPKRTATP